MSNVRFERRQLLIIPENTIVVHQKKNFQTQLCVTVSLHTIVYAEAYQYFAIFTAVF